MAADVYKPRVILKRVQVQARTGLSRSSIYNAIKQGTFPAQVSLGPRAVGWLESSIDDWIQKRIAISSMEGSAS